MTERSLPLGLPMNLRWDGDDKLIEASGSGTNYSETYHYDHTGQRAWAVSQGKVRFWFGESETQYDLGGGAPLYRYISIGDDTGSIGRAVAEADTSGPGSHRRRFNGKEDDLASGLRYYGARYYDPYLLRWNARVPLFGTVPELGLGSPQEHNLYAFSLNNPLRYVDLDGLDANDDGTYTAPPFEKGTHVGSDGNGNWEVAPDAAASDCGGRRCLMATWVPTTCQSGACPSRTQYFENVADDGSPFWA
jgi:RHS repeat-associated protein